MPKQILIEDDGYILLDDQGRSVAALGSPVALEGITEETAIPEDSLVRLEMIVCIPSHSGAVFGQWNVGGEVFFLPDVEDKPQWALKLMESYFNDNSIETAFIGVYSETSYPV